MNKTFKYALGAVLTFGVIAPALAQDQFPDVPDNHWAYEALARMKREGLLVGYPDGLFRGNRPASRYELAVAVHATYAHLKGITDALEGRIAALERGGTPQTGGPTREEFDALKRAVEQLQADVNNMKGWGNDIADLRRMAQTFERELRSMGVDVEAMKRDLTDLARRVGVLEANKLPVNIHGDANLLMLAGASTSNRAGITVDGRPVGVMDTVFAGPTFAPVGASQDLSIFHEAAVQLTGNNETGPQWRATLVMGNLLGMTGAAGGSAAFPSQSTLAPGVPFGEVATDVYLQDLAVRFDTSLVGQGFSAEVGRTGYSISPYLFQRPDVTPYYSNDRWDNGNWTFDGAILGFEFGGAEFNVFGGRNAQRLTSNGVELNAMTVGAVGHRYTPGGGRPVGLPGGMMVDQSLGFHLNVPIGESGDIDLAYIFLESNTGVAGVGGRAANRAQVFGGDVKWNFGPVVFDAGYAQSNLLNGNDTVINRDNFAWHASLGYEAERWGAMVGYREIRPQFAAPGDWGRIGIWWNPTDIKGIDANVHFNLTDDVKLSASGQFYNGTGRTITAPAAFGGFTTTGLSTSDDITRWTADLGYRLNEAWNLNLGVEWVDWNLNARPGFAGGSPEERWYNIGLGYNLSDMAKLSFLWQISDYNGAGAGGANIGFSPFGNPLQQRATGNLITTQLSVKF